MRIRGNRFHSCCGMWRGRRQSHMLHCSSLAAAGKAGGPNRGSYCVCSTKAAQAGGSTVRPAPNTRSLRRRWKVQPVDARRKPIFYSLATPMVETELRRPCQSIACQAVPPHRAKQIHCFAVRICISTGAPPWAAMLDRLQSQGHSQPKIRDVCPEEMRLLVVQQTLWQPLRERLATRAQRHPYRRRKYENDRDDRSGRSIQNKYASRLRLSRSRQPPQ